MIRYLFFRNALLGVLLFMVIPSVQAYTERNMLQNLVGSEEQLRELLVLNQEWVPYPRYQDRKAWDILLGERNKAFLIKAGEKILDYQWQHIPATAYLEYSRKGTDYQMKPYWTNRENINILMLAELAEGKGRFVDQLINGVYYSCESTSWVISSHLKNQNPRCLLPDYRRPIVELASGDYGSILAWVYYFFRDTFDKVEPIISLRLRQELQERMLDAFMNNNEWWMANEEWSPDFFVNNWNPWCNCNILQCFLLLENDPEKLVKAVWRGMRSVDKFLNFVKADGACEEGSTYWTHAVGKLYDYLQVLSYATHGKITLLNDPMIRRMGEYICRSYVGNGWVVNFADASAKGGGDAPLIFRYGQALGSEEMMCFAAYLLNGKKPDVTLGKDTFQSLESILKNAGLEQTKPSHFIPVCTWYPETEFCHLTNKSGWFLAAKGGHNNESHNHNDVGTCILYVNTTPLLIDAGVGTYTRQTFSSERYQIWTMQSDYHNLPIINGVSQHQGGEFKATDVMCRPTRGEFSLNIASAYPEQAKVKRWIRSYQLKEHKLIISDQFGLTEGITPNQVNFLTWGKVEATEIGRVKIEANGESVTLQYPANFELLIEPITLSDPPLSGVWGKEIYRIVLKDKKVRMQGHYQFMVY